MLQLLTRLAFVLLAVQGTTYCFAEDEILSPDGQVVVNVMVDDSSQLRYGIAWNVQPVIESSALGISVDGIDLGAGVSIGEPTISRHDETYATRGVHTTARDHHQRVVFPVTHVASGRDYELEFRVFDDGVAYRYLVPNVVSASEEDDDQVQHVDGESSSWKVVAGAKAWYFERLTKGWKLRSYAGEWVQTDIEKLDSVSPVGPLQGTPVMLQLPNDLGYAAITKAATYNYSGMRLKATGDRTLKANFTEGDAGFYVQGTVTTPWRVTMLADNLNELVNSDLIKNLNPAPDAELFADTNYIKPGRTAWSWETRGLGTPETQREFIDLAANMGFEYSTIDDGWKDWDNPWETVEELCNHAKQQNVGAWLWVHSQDIKDPAGDYQQMRDYFAKVAGVGAVGLKIDFMNGESKELIDFEIAVLRNAAKAKLMINFHGCHASTGEERTFPNEMTREGIRGIEVNKMREGPIPAWHNAALPYTRFVVGHADYTPVLFSNPGPTTWAHQIATLVQFTTALQTYAEHPQYMMEDPILSKAFPVLKSIPPIWDETLVLPGTAIGKLSVMARRSDDQWFVGILNGENTEREYTLDLSFLPEGSHQAEMVLDDIKSPRVNLVGINKKANLHQYTTVTPCKVEERHVERDQALSIRLAPGGGCVLRIKGRNESQK